MVFSRIGEHKLKIIKKMVSNYTWEAANDQAWTIIRKDVAKMVSTVVEETANDPDLTTIMKEMAEDEVLTPPCSSTRESPTPLAPTQPTLIVEERMIQSLQCSTDIAADLAPGSSLEEERSIAIINPSVPARSPLHHETEPNGGELMQLVRPKQLSLVEFDATKYGENVVSADQSCTVICHSEKKITRATLERKCPRTECLISSEDLQQHFGWKRVDAAESFGVSASLVNHICRQLGNQMLGGSTPSHEELLQEGTRFLEEERSVEIINPLMDENLDCSLQFVRTPQPARSRPHHEAEPNGEELMQLALSEKGHLVEFDPTNYRQNVVNADQSSAAISYSKNKNIRETLERKRGGTENSISLDVINQHAGMSLQEAAERLGVSRSTLKRICRKNGIQKWPRRKIKKDTPSTSKQASATVTDCPCDQALATVAHTKMQDVDMVTVKAKHVNQIIKFQLSFSSGLVELQRQVAKRLNIEGESYYIKYEDEDKDLISIACDEDLQHYIGTRKSLDSTSIRVLLEPK